MNIRHLQIFVTVADCGKMRAAAEKLHISQPSVSQAIRELEEYYDIRLFDRLSQRIYITEKGKNLLPYARHIVDSYGEMEEYAFDAAGKNIIRIGGSVSVGTVLLPDIIGQLKAALPNVDVRVVVDNTTTIEQMVLGSELDVAIVEGTIDNLELIRKDIFEDELVLVVGKSHPLFASVDITLEQLTGQALISREAGSAERNQFERYLSEHDIHMVSKWSCSNTETIKHAVEAGEGIAILSRMLVKDEVKNDTLRIVHVEGVRIKRYMKLVYHRNKYITEPMQKLLEICEKM